MLKRHLRQHKTLLRIRKRQEDIKALALAVAHRKVSVAEEELVNIKTEQMHMFELANDTIKKKFDPFDLRRYYQYERHLAHLADDKDSQIVQLMDEASERRTELEEAMKSRRIIERLNERRLTSYISELQKEEQKFNDEVATNRSANMRPDRDKP